MSTGKNRRTIYIFTTDLPDGPTETFMLNELEELSRRDVRLVMFPYRKKALPHSEIDEKIEVNTCMREYDECRQKIDVGLILFFFRVILIDVINNPKDGFKTFKSLRSVFSLYKTMYFKATYFMQCIDRFDPNALYYTYWWEDWSLMLCILKLKGSLNGGRLVTRAHGFDLYAERRQGFIPLRGLQLKCTDRIYTISKHGRDYLKTKFPRFKNKIFNFYLGTSDNGFVFTKRNQQEYQLISISDFREVKRVWLIVEILKHMKVNVKWTHVGAGKDFEESKKNLGLEKLPENVRYDFKGFLGHDELYVIFKSVPFDLFINVSSSEGLPLSIMEAMSMGVPAVATDVGGTAELITRQTGFLIKSNFNPQAAAGEITEYLMNLRVNDECRQQVRSYWEQHFRNSVNSKQFADHLLAE